jgi:hypothetical protein
MIACEPADQYTRFCSYLSAKLVQPSLKLLHDELKQEIHMNYDRAVRQGIIEYMLLDPNERERVKIYHIPRRFRSRTIRAPIAWHDTMELTKNELQTTLHVNNPIMSALQTLWDDVYAQQRFVKYEDLLEASLPIKPDDFEKLIEQYVHRMRQTLLVENVRSIHR